MAKLTLNDIVSGYGTATLYNANNTLIEAAIENTLSLDGTSPNAMQVDLDMNSQNITNLANPVNNQDAATKYYGDENWGGASADAAAASAAAALASETAAAVSAAAAAASYDSFDDRYLGIKASPPTLDNDGDALVDGTLYFNSTDDTMYIYNGGWVASVAASAANAVTFTPAGTIAATDVQAAVEEVASEAATALSDHLTDTVAAHAASAVAFTPVGTIAATDAQTAIAEVATDAITRESLLAPIASPTFTGSFYAPSIPKIIGVYTSSHASSLGGFPTISGVSVEVGDIIVWTYMYDCVRDGADASMEISFTNTGTCTINTNGSGYYPTKFIFHFEVTASMGTSSIIGSLTQIRTVTGAGTFTVGGGSAAVFGTAPTSQRDANTVIILRPNI
jgi:hypothetical protein